METVGEEGEKGIRSAVVQLSLTYPAEKKVGIHSEL